MDLLLRVGEVARMLNVNRKTVLQWIEEGQLDAIELPPTSVRDLYRVRSSKLEEFLEAHTTTHKEEDHQLPGA